MKTKVAATRALASVLLAAAAFGAGCRPAGPVERAGQKVDQGVQGVQDAISPPGPVEKAARSVDRALDN